MGTATGNSAMDLGDLVGVDTVLCIVEVGVGVLGGFVGSCGGLGVLLTIRGGSRTSSMGADSNKISSWASTRFHSQIELGQVVHGMGSAGGVDKRRCVVGGESGDHCCGLGRCAGGGSAAGGTGDRDAA